jgi:hypothetical protein
MKNIKTFENFGIVKKNVISSLTSGDLFTTNNWEDLAPLYLAIQQGNSGKLEAVPTQNSPSELKGLVFSYKTKRVSDYKHSYELEKIRGGKDTGWRSGEKSTGIDTGWRSGGESTGV